RPSAQRLILPALFPKRASDPKRGRSIPSRPRPQRPTTAKPREAASSLNPAPPPPERPSNVKPRGGSSSVDLATTIQWIIPIAGIAAVLFAGYLARNV